MVKRYGLTPAQFRIALLVARGYSTTEILTVIGKSRKTFDTHLNAVYKTLRCSNRVQVAIYCQKLGLIDLNSVDLTERQTQERTQEEELA